MKEVSTKVFDILHRPLRKKGIGAGVMVAGTRISAAVLRDKNERIDWEDYVAVMRNIRPTLHRRGIPSSRAFIHAGTGPALRIGDRETICSRRWTSTDGLNKPRDGFGNQMFSCIMPSHREVAADQIELDLILPDGFEVCWDFFLIAAGNMEEVPRLFGLPRTR